MNYLYTINLYKNDKKIHSEQLISLGNYKSLNRLLVGEEEITPEEYVVVNGKMLIAVIENILLGKYLEVEPQPITVTNSDGNEVVKIHHPLTNLSALFIRLVLEAQVLNEAEEDGDNLILSTAVHNLFNSHDLFTNVILSNLFATLNCVDDITGDVKEGFKLTVKVEEDE